MRQSGSEPSGVRFRTDNGQQATGNGLRLKETGAEAPVSDAADARTSEIVGALAMRGSVETFALVFFRHAQTDNQVDDLVRDGRHHA